jgi:hypothetical protein
MEMAEALKIMRALSDGVNPYTGEILQAESVYQNPQTVRALHRAAKALEYAQVRERRKRILPENAGQSWSSEEDQQLCQELRNGIDFRDIANTHCRTRGAIMSRLAKLGMIPPNT